MHRPRLLCLDEPTTGLEPEARGGVWQLASGLPAEGLAVVRTTQAARLSDVLTGRAPGRVVAPGSPGGARRPHRAAPAGRGRLPGDPGAPHLAILAVLAGAMILVLVPLDLRLRRRRGPGD